MARRYWRGVNLLRDAGQGYPGWSVGYLVLVAVVCTRNCVYQALGGAAASDLEAATATVHVYRILILFLAVL